MDFYYNVCLFSFKLSYAQSTSAKHHLFSQIEIFARFRSEHILKKKEAYGLSTTVTVDTEHRRAGTSTVAHNRRMKDIINVYY